jgi:hypothetical protein
MKKNNAHWFLALVATCLILAVGCSSTMRLRYDRPPSSETNKGEISVLVTDQRPPNRGGSQPLRVGTVRNTFGMPFPLKASADREPPKVAAELVSDCLKAAGYRVVQGSGGIPQLHVLLQTFWTDGYQRSRMGLTMPMKLGGDEGSAPAWSYLLDANIGVTWTAGYRQFDRGFSKLLEDAKHKLIAEFNDPRFRSSYSGNLAGN